PKQLSRSAIRILLSKRMPEMYAAIVLRPPKRRTAPDGRDGDRFPSGDPVTKQLPCSHQTVPHRPAWSACLSGQFATSAQSASTFGQRMQHPLCTYEFIDAMIASAARIFRSRTIHIGCDEAWNLGLGNYFWNNGLRPKAE